jgi:hypothetical protein
MAGRGVPIAMLTSDLVLGVAANHWVRDGGVDRITSLYESAR